jgi:hypothetical protein
MKKILGIIILSFIIFSAGAISGTGGLDTKSTKRNVDSFQTKTIELAYTSVIDIWTAFKQVEIFMLASQENIDASFNRFREDQVKIAVAGFVNFKNANSNKSDAYLSDNLSLLEDEPNKPAINENTDFPPNQDINFMPTQIIDPTTDASTDALINNPHVNRNTDVRNKIVE